MRKVKIESVADFDALPEGEWVEVPDGLKVELVFGKEWDDGNGDRLVINVPRDIARRIKGMKGRRLKARFTGRRLIVEK
jgi:hypothetical protein